MGVWEYGSMGVNSLIDRIKTNYFYGALQDESDA